jgi:hypothetical protein
MPEVEKRNRSPRREFPVHSLEETLPLAQKIQDEMAGRPMNRLLLADAVGIKPSSSNFRLLLSSAYKYGLTDGTEKADTIGLTEELGQGATQKTEASKRTASLRLAALHPAIFAQVLKAYNNKKVPSDEMLPKILTAQYKIPKEIAAECAQLIVANARYTGMIRDIGGSPHVLLDDSIATPPPIAPQAATLESSEMLDSHYSGAVAAQALPPGPTVAPSSATQRRAKPIFIGHGKNTAPLQKLETLLSTFQIPYKVTVKEANLGRPIPQKVRETMEECGSAILLFTKDELFYDAGQKEIWRPSENVVHELGAAAFLYGDRVVIFKENGLHFPTNYQSIGYIEFEIDTLEAKTADLLKELIGFGLVKIMPT